MINLEEKKIGCKASIIFNPRVNSLKPYPPLPPPPPPYTCI